MIRIERLKKEDIHQLLELYKELVPFDNKVCEAEKLYEEMIQDDNYYFIVAKKGDELLGSILGICVDIFLSTNSNVGTIFFIIFLKIIK